jgi:hypothetical protein
MILTSASVLLHVRVEVWRQWFGYYSLAFISIH